MMEMEMEMESTGEELRTSSRGLTYRVPGTTRSAGLVRRSTDHGLEHEQARNRGRAILARERRRMNLEALTPQARQTLEHLPSGEAIVAAGLGPGTHTDLKRLADEMLWDEDVKQRNLAIIAELRENDFVPATPARVASISLAGLTLASDAGVPLGKARSTRERDSASHTEALSVSDERTERG